MLCHEKSIFKNHFLLLAAAGSLKLVIEGYSQPVEEGSDLVLYCVDKGANVDVSYRWQFTPNGTMDPTEGPQAQSYFKEKVAVSDSGDYTCKASSVIGSGEAVITVRILPASTKSSDNKDDDDDGPRLIRSDLRDLIWVFVILILIVSLVLFTVGLIFAHRKMKKRKKEQRTGMYAPGMYFIFFIFHHFVISPRISI